MAPRARNYGTWIRMTAVGLAIAVGGPAFTWYLTPTEEQLFKKYNPELQKRSLENRQERQQDFDDFVTKLKEYSKSSKPIWEVAREDEQRKKDGKIAERHNLSEEIERRKQEMRKETGTLVPGASL